MVPALLLDPVGCPGWDGASVSGGSGVVIGLEATDRALSLSKASTALTR